MQIGNDLIEAYDGYYEDEMPLPFPTIEDKKNWVIEKIQSHSPRKRLEIYLKWNGILGYTNRIWEISQGEL